MERKNSGARAGKFRSYRRKRRRTDCRSFNRFSSNARSEAFSGCHARCHGKRYSRRLLGIFKLGGSIPLSATSVGKPFATDFGMFVFDAVDGSSTGTGVPRMGLLLRPPLYGGAKCR